MTGREIKAKTHQAFLKWAREMWEEYSGEAEHSEGFEYWKDMIENPEDGLEDILRYIANDSRMDALR